MKELTKDQLFYLNSHDVIVPNEIESSCSMGGAYVNFKDCFILRNFHLTKKAFFGMPLI